jgi:RHS repeat-associated protein
MRSYKSGVLLAVVMACFVLGAVDVKVAHAVDIYLTKAQADALVAAGILKKCGNGYYVKPCSPCDDGRKWSLAGFSGNWDILCDVLNNVVITSDGSLIDNSSFNHHHIAMDYSPGRAAGCGSCGGCGASQAELPSLTIERRHRLRDASWPSSFGPGVFCNFDKRVLFHNVGGATLAYVFDPSDLYPNPLIDDGGAPAVLNTHPGASGGYYADYSNVVGSKIKWDITASAGSATLTFRYANGSTANRPLQVRVNDAAVGTLNFGPTGDWVTWGDTSIAATLVDGANTISLVAVQATGPNVDCMTVSTLPDVFEAETAVVTADNRSGVFEDRRMKAIKDMRMVNGLGQVVAKPSEATHVEIRNYQGLLHRFEMINLTAPDGALPQAGVHWRFDEGAATVTKDSSGNQLDGALTGGTRWWRMGKVEGAVDFDGSDDAISNTDAAAQINGQSALTVAMWIRSNLVDSDRGFVSGKDPDNTDNILSFRYDKAGFYGGGTNVIKVGLNTSGGYVQLESSSGVQTKQWQHVAFTWQSGQPVKLYINGQLDTPTFVSPTRQGAIQGVLKLLVGKGQLSTSSWNGLIDDFRLYTTALTSEQIQVLAVSNSAYAARVVRIEEPNGHGITINYKGFDEAELLASPERQWQIDEVVDAHDRTATFHYHSNQVAGRWVVSQIDLPGQRSVAYEYSSQNLIRVVHPDSSESTIAYAFYPGSNTTEVTYNDAAADGTHRRKSVYLTNQITLFPEDTDEEEALVNQPSLVLRTIVNGEGEVTYVNIPAPGWGGNETLVYDGGGRLGSLHGAWGKRYYTRWQLADPSGGYAGFDWTQAELESTFVETKLGGDELVRFHQGTLNQMQDERGRLFNYEYDNDTFVTRKIYPDLSSERWQYGVFKQVTRHEDRMGRVTKFTYDPDTGNKLTREVGIVNTRVYENPTPNYSLAPIDVNQPEHALYQWQYYGESETVDGVVQPKGLLKAAIDAGGNATRYVYNENKLLWRVYEPDDEGAGDHLAQQLSYDTAGRVQTTVDAMGRTFSFAYDARDRHVQTIYSDGSTEETLYGTGVEANLVVARKDRNGSVSIYRYDGHGRQTETVAAASHVGAQGTILENYTRPAPQDYLAEAAVTTTTYLEGTNQPLSITSQGATTSYAYDYRRRTVETTVQPRVGHTLISRRAYLNNELFSMEDPFGRKSYNAYRAADGSPIRTLRLTVPESQAGLPPLSDFAAVLDVDRDLGPNAKYLVTDYLPNTAGDVVETIDPRDVIHKTIRDSRGRAVEQIAAFGTAVAAKTQTIYDADDNVLEVRGPRWFDGNDTNGFQKASEQWTYTRRDLKKTHTVAAGDAAYPTGAKVTQSWTYNLDRTVDTHTDFRGNAWETLWSLCCSARVTAQVDPLGAANTSDYDSNGNVTHSQRLHGETIFNQITTRYDARHRPTARTVWLEPQQVLSPQNPPIAGGGLAGDPAAHDAQGNTVGLTTRYLYDEDLTDGVGLDSAQGVSLPKLKDQGNLNVSIAAMLAEMNADLADGQPVLGEDCAGSATTVLNPEDEISVSIQDGAGRTIATGIIRQDGTPITWQSIKHDAIVTIAGYGDVVETAQIDALNHVTRSRTDGAGRTIQSLDALGKISSFKYDANGNMLSVRDPNSVGWDAGTALGTFDGYDVLGRLTARIDTQGDTTAMGYNADSNVVRATDAKSQNTLFAYDARGRKVSMTDRINGVTTLKHDQNGNMLELCDADNQAANKPTVWTYDARNMKLTEAYPGHNPASQVGGADYDQKIFGYDLAGRPATFADQQGDTVTHGFDMAGRLVQRDYRLAVNSPDGQVADSDVLAYDDAGRLIAATSGRYNNTVSLAYADGAGRLTAESLAVDFGQPRTYTVGSQYDAANRRTEITYPDGSAVVRAYTARDQLEQIDYNADMVATFAYDDGGRRTTRTLGDQPGTQTTWSYGRQDDLITGISTPNVTSFAYTYDANKNKLTETIGGVMQPYGFTVPQNGYDAADRLVGWNRDDSQKNQSWDLSLAGDWNQFTENAVTQTRSHNNVHEVTGIDQAPLAHDPKGNLTLNVNGQAYTWDFDNRLSSATIGANTHGYTYDALGRRVSKTYMTAGGTDEQATETLVFVNSIQAIKHSPFAGQELAEYAANADASATPPLRKYVYGYYVDEPVMMLTAGEMETKWYYYANAHYSVAALASEAGVVQERYAYTAYGEPVFFDGVGSIFAPQPAGSPLNNPFLFTGRRLDSEIASQYTRARYYDFRLGRFIGRDPIGIRGGANLYKYSDKPLERLDPSGYETTPSPEQVAYAKRLCKCECFSWYAAFRYPLGKVMADMTTIMADANTEASQATFDASQLAAAYYGESPTAEQITEFENQVGDSGRLRGDTVATHSALRHCIGSGLLAASYDCDCSQCVSDSREYHQFHKGQTLRWTQMTIYNNFVGRQCAGCTGAIATVNPSTMHVGPYGVTARTETFPSKQGIINCCINALRQGKLDVETGDPKAPKDLLDPIRRSPIPTELLPPSPPEPIIPYPIYM